MNKQKLIESIEKLNKLYGERYYVSIDDVLNLVKQLDEPQPVKVPQFVAEKGELATRFTRKQIEDAGLGEVFNSPLFEVEEVE